jgi:hypothetical protein
MLVQSREARTSLWRYPATQGKDRINAIELSPSSRRWPILFFYCNIIFIRSITYGVYNKIFYTLCLSNIAIAGPRLPRWMMNALLPTKRKRPPARNMLSEESDCVEASTLSQRWQPVFVRTCWIVHSSGVPSKRFHHHHSTRA